MMRRLAAVAAVLAVRAHAGGLYTKRSPVIQVDSSNYNQIILDSNHTSVVEFYAPWCGHCQNLKPEYEKAAEALAGLAKVAAVNCDDDDNKQLCASLDIQGFPTIKIVRPSMNRNSRKRDSRPSVDDYNGQRSAQYIFNVVKDSINNHVSRLSDKNLDAFLAGDKPKALLFSDKGTTSALLRSIAIDFLDVISIGQVRDKEEAAVDKFGIEKFPTLVLLPGEAKESVIYTGEFNKKEMVDFLSQAGQPNPDAAPKAKDKDKKPKDNEKGTKDKKDEDKKKDDKDNGERKRPSKTEPESESSTTESATPTPDVISITTITSMDMLVDKCLQPKSHTCVLAFIPSPASEQGNKVVASLSQLKTKYLHGKRHLFPFLSVTSNVEGASLLRDALKLNADVELVVVNARRAWWRRYEGDFGVESVEDWIDAIRMGEGKNDLPKGVVVEAGTAESSTKATESESSESTESMEKAKASESTKTKAAEATDSTDKTDKAKVTEASESSEKKEKAKATKATESTEKADKAKETKSSESTETDKTKTKAAEETDKANKATEATEATKKSDKAKEAAESTEKAEETTSSETESTKTKSKPSESSESKATDAESKTESEAQEGSAKAKGKVVHEEL